MPNFHNPYNFIPLGDESNLKHRGAPMGHHRLHENLYTGTIDVKLTTVTPLLIVDPETVTEEAGHKTFHGIVMNPITPGLPDIPITSLRGMLRAAYEAITESRLGVWSKRDHDLRLGFRLSTKIGAQVIPARVVNGQLLLYLGEHKSSFTDIRSFIKITMAGGKAAGTAPKGVLYAAWLPLRSLSPFKHKEEVAFNSELFERQIWNKQWRRHEWTFNYWMVRSCVKKGSTPSTPGVSGSSKRIDGKKWHNTKGVISGSFTGFVVASGHNTENKHNERIFYGEVNSGVAVTADHAKAYANLIIDYQKQHKEDIEAGKTMPSSARKLGTHPPISYSRHIMESHKKLAASERDIEGQFVYALFDSTGNLEKLFPVMISRDLFDEAPNKCLPDVFRPARNLAEASPADRLFGFVNSEGHGAHKGQVRISKVKAINASVVSLGNGLTMAILGQPKPSMGPFYLLQGKEPVKTKAASYKCGEGQKIRGRKVYLTHRTEKSYWDPSHDAGQEFRAPSEVGKSTQNKTIKQWVKEGSVFTFRVQVTNCTEEELSALLWLLDLGKSEEGWCLSLGGSKPLGLGAVKMEIAKSCLARGSDWGSAFGALAPLQSVSDHGTLISKLKMSEDIKAAFLAAAKGIDTSKTSIHYPRVEPFRKKEVLVTDRGELNFEWYRRTALEGGCLPLLSSLTAFSTDVQRSARPGGGGGGNRGGGQNRGGGGGGGYKGDQNRRSGPPPSQGRRREPGS